MASSAEGIGHGRQAYIHPARPHSKIHKVPGVMEGGSYLTLPHTHFHSGHPITPQRAAVGPG